MGLVLDFGEVLVKGHACVEHLGLVFELLGLIISYHFYISYCDALIKVLVLGLCDSVVQICISIYSL